MAEDKRFFSERFKQFSRFGDTKSDGRQITLSQSDKWMKQAKVIDGKRITTTDTGIHFKKLRALKISEREYIKFLEELGQTKKVSIEEIKTKMGNCGPPRLSSAGGKSLTPPVSRRSNDPAKLKTPQKQ